MASSNLTARPGCATRVKMADDKATTIFRPTDTQRKLNSTLPLTKFLNSIIANFRTTPTIRVRGFRDSLAFSRRSSSFFFLHGQRNPIAATKCNARAANNEGDERDQLSSAVLSTGVGARGTGNTNTIAGYFNFSESGPLSPASKARLPYVDRALVVADSSDGGAGYRPEGAASRGDG